MTICMTLEPSKITGAAAVLGFSYFFWRGGISGWPAVVWFSFAALVILFCLRTVGNYRFAARRDTCGLTFGLHWTPGRAFGKKERVMSEKIIQTTEEGYYS